VTDGSSVWRGVGRGREVRLWAFEVAVVAVVAVICAAVVHHACFDATSAIAAPSSGTPRGEYCAAVEPWRPWISFTIGPTVVAALIAWFGRRRQLIVMPILLVVCAILVADALVASSLRLEVISPLT
jgi:hypothetical protein